MGLAIMRDNLLLLFSLYDTHKTDELKIIRNKLKCKYQSAIKLAKIAAHYKIILNSSNKQKSMWSLINKNRNPKNYLNILFHLIILTIIFVP